MLWLSAHHLHHAAQASTDHTRQPATVTDASFVRAIHQLPMMQLPDCRICREDYDLGQRLPVVLTCCGCYICKECARQLNTCPHCYK
eukprot:33749-Eustigmatos_ZCMA.PRE.1